MVCFNILRIVLVSLTSYEALIGLKTAKFIHFKFVTLAMVRVRVLVNNALYMLLRLIVDCLDAVEERCMLGFFHNRLEWCFILLCRNNTSLH